MTVDHCGTTTKMYRNLAVPNVGASLRVKIMRKKINKKIIYKTLNDLYTGAAELTK